MRKSFGSTAAAVAAALAFTAVPQLSHAQSQCTSGQLSAPFGFTGAQQSFVVPAGYLSAVLHLRGAQGAPAPTIGSGGSGTGGLGGAVSGTRLVTPGDTIFIFVGGQGNTFNGAGTGARVGGTGGGASDVRAGGNAVANRIAVAGGGGGGGAPGATDALSGCTGVGPPYTGGNGGLGGGGAGGNSAGFTGGGSSATGAGGGSPGVGGLAGAGCSFASGQPGTSAGAGGQSYPPTCQVGDGGGGGGGALAGGGGGGGSAGTLFCTLNTTTGGGGGGGGTSNASGLTAATLTSGVHTGNGSVELCLILGHVVTPVAGPNGSLTPATAQLIADGATTTFTATPNANHSLASWGGTCPGTPSGNTFATSAITADCTVTATFAIDTYTVTPSAGANGSIAPSTPQTIAHGSTTTFTATPNAGYSTAWSGTCPGTPSGNTFAAGPITASCTVGATFTLNTYTVTPSAGANGTIAPSTPQTVAHGGTATFTATPNAGYTTAWSGTCPGTPSGNTFTTGPITAACTVGATFTQNTYTVTPSAGANGTIAPSTPQTIAHGGTTTFTATPNAGYTTAWSGTCPGTPSGNTFTAGPITAACTVGATFTQNTYTVTPSAGANGTIAPSTPQTIAHGATATFTVTPNAGYNATVGGTCGGSLAGSTYTTAPITAACTVAATFASGAVTTFTGPTATGTGNATVTFSGGGPTCGFAPQGNGPMQSAFFIPVSGHPKSPPAGTAPAEFPHGLLDFVLVNCAPGAAMSFTVQYPAPLPAATRYWKYGPTPTNTAPHWYNLAATIAGSTATFAVVDGGLGDDDLAANGTVVDQGGPGVPAPGELRQVPTLSTWAMILLCTLLLAVAMRNGNFRRD